MSHRSISGRITYHCFCVERSTIRLYHQGIVSSQTQKEEWVSSANFIGPRNTRDRIFCAYTDAIYICHVESSDIPQISVLVAFFPEKSCMCRVSNSHCHLPAFNFGRACRLPLALCTGPFPRAVSNTAWSLAYVRTYLWVFFCHR
jgi:hypothetical protein